MKTLLNNLKKFLKKIIFNKSVALILIKPVLKLHSMCYYYAGRLGIILNNGLHPKHQILEYKEWFLKNIPEKGIILDIGCSTGELPKILSKKAKYIYGVEIDKKAISIANRENKKNNITYICSDAENYDYSKCLGIDCITLSNVLEHIENRNKFLKSLVNKTNWQENKKKMFLIRVPLLEREWIVIYKKQLNVEYRLDPTHYIEYTYEKLKNELEDANIIISDHSIRFGELFVKAYVGDSIQ